MTTERRCSLISRWLLANLIAVIGAFAVAGTAVAADPDPAADANETTESGKFSSPIPVGTVINAQNWQNYRQYMTVGQQTVIGGLPRFKLPSDWKIEVGPYTDVPAPRTYRDDTEKYAGTVTLKALPTGGFMPENYVAGVPFPNAATNPNEPNRGIKLLYNTYYNYKPMLMYKPDVVGHAVDRYGNITNNLLIQVITRMNHISEPGTPNVLPNRLPDTFNVQYNEQILPEQSKYTVVLALFPDDPSKEEQIFLFIPSLRRSLRSSSASRCAPFAGSDNFYDDINAGFNGIPTQFTVKVLDSPKMILTMVNRAKENTTDADYHRLNFFWPKSVLGKWELRPVYALELHPIESELPGYCYPRKVIYVDKQNYQILGDDRYDTSQKFWKAGLWWFWKTPIPNSPGDYTFNSFLNASLLIVDFQNQHFTAGYFNSSTVNTEVPAKYRNIHRYASPAGLAEIMQ